MPDQQEVLKNLWKHFKKITELPHVSGHEEPVRNYIYEFARTLSDVKIKSSAGDDKVVVLQKHPSQKPLFVLQSHMDMVYTPPDMEFPLQLNYNEFPGWIGAIDKSGRKSTLGADDGIGTAAALALLESDYDRGFECLFTNEEETTMSGAATFDLNLLDAGILLNLDSEDVETITYGSAGGSETYIHLPISRETLPQGMKYVELGISGLTGGHSGVCIDMGRLNAVKILNQCLAQLNRKYEFNLVSLRGGHAKNAIPVEAVYGIAISQQIADDFVKDFHELCFKLKEANKINEPGFHHIVSEKSVLPGRMLTVESTKKALNLVVSIPNGVIRRDKSLVMTSNNLGIIAISDDYIDVYCFHRSSSESEIGRITGVLETIGNFYCCEVIPNQNSFPPWEPVEDSVILNLVKEVYGVGTKTEVTHGGLECAFFYSRYRGAMDCISIGPTILDPHSDDERINIESISLFLNRLLQITEKVKSLT